MNPSLETETPAVRRHWQHFGGSWPALRIVARLAVASLLVAWLSWGLMSLDYPNQSVSYLWFLGHIFAFVLGVSSLCPLGGISALLSLLTFFAALSSASTWP